MSCRMYYGIKNLRKLKSSVSLMLLISLFSLTSLIKDYVPFLGEKEYLVTVSQLSKVCLILSYFTRKTPPVSALVARAAYLAR